MFSAFRFNEEGEYNEEGNLKLLPSNPYLYNYKKSLLRIKPIIEIRSSDMKHFPDNLSMLQNFYVRVKYLNIR